MSNKFKVRKIKEVLKILNILNFTLISQRGSHIKYSYNNITVTVPNHKEISIGTLNEIYKTIRNVHENTQLVDDLFLEK